MADGELEYERLKNKAHEEYSKIGKVFCPNLKTEVAFNSNGFWHILYRGRGKKRDSGAQVMRFKLLSKAVSLVSETATLQEYDSFTGEVPTKDHTTRILKLTKVEYYGYIGIFDGWKIKVIIKRLGNGQPFFWSVIPNWVTNRKRDSRFSYRNSAGNLEED